MLVAAGVDGLSLHARVSALDPAQREVFSSRFATQRALVEKLVGEARFAERTLVTKGHADALEDGLVASLPWPAPHLTSLAPQVLSQERLDAPGSLEVLRTNSTQPTTRALAALALLRNDDERREVLQDCLSHLHAEDPLGLEALYALTRAQLGLSLRLFDRQHVEPLRALIKRAREARPDSIEVALANAALGTLTERNWAPPDADVHLLREGLNASAPVIRFACAQLLKDEPTLDALVEAPKLRDAALRELANLKSPVLVRRFREARNEDERARLLRTLRPPHSAEAFTAIVGALEVSSVKQQHELLLALQRNAWDEVDEAARRSLELWLDGRTLPLEDALNLIRWAVSTKENTRPFRSAEQVRPLALACARSLAAAPRTQQTVRAHGVDDFFAVADEGPALELIAQWLQQDETRAHALGHVFDLISRLESYAQPKDDRGVRLFVKLWERLGETAQRAQMEALAESFRRDLSSQAREVLLPRLWERFVTREREREAIWTVTRACRREMTELRDADERAQGLDGGDPLRRFALYSACDPLTAPELLRETMQAKGDTKSDDRQLAQLTPVIVERAGTLFVRGKHRHAMWLAASYGSFVVNRFREDDSREPWRAAALGLTGFVQAIAQKRRDTRPEDPNDSLKSFEEQLDTELRIVRETVEREEDTRRREAERAAQEAAREAERKRRDDERKAEVARR
ncbi:MAG: hypothetical protein JST92_19225, partial [Deltaproteobacteria bacterium]|nr:hypothetical protein [Deltaproteobacteria bacterium]